MKAQEEQQNRGKKRQENKNQGPKYSLAELGNFHWDSYATYIQEHNLQDSKAREQRGSQKMQAKAAKKRKSNVCESTLMVPIDQILIKGLWVH